jgi:hypothetical protein
VKEPFPAKFHCGQQAAAKSGRYQPLKNAGKVLY